MIWTAANFITAFRLGLFAWFIVLVSEGKVETAGVVFFFVWALDAVDGFLARKLGQASEVGSLFDKAADRLMIGGAFFALLAYGIAPAGTVLIFTKDIGLLLVWLFRPDKRQIDMGVPGKIATFLQGVTLLWVMLSWPYQLALILVTAVFGAGIAARGAAPLPRLKASAPPSYPSRAQGRGRKSESYFPLL